ncbi:hypothetical protein BZG36_04231 [Bifiguratus adelaidae]|uniref:RING-type domain-containing protein n=1 Tax=Bifiguratus adelaidae TaxID=1938954 RepID=A0A261XY74_9FUNG|nr:hypothetical protein BZG36_04231 [Bifiguratus adelaidae]
MREDAQETNADNSDSTSLAFSFIPSFTNSLLRSPLNAFSFSFSNDLKDAPQVNAYTIQFPSFRLCSISNLLVAYAIPILFLFFPALILPLIFLRSMALVIACTDPNSELGLLRARLQSKDPRLELEYWLQRCSICFDRRLDLCLEFCKDQFCRDCFRRYVEASVSSSWGLTQTKIKCPVCRDVIPQAEWSRYVPRELVQRFERYNRPYMSFGRFCSCGAEVVVCMHAAKYGDDRKCALHQMHEEVAEFLGQIEGTLPMVSSDIADLYQATSTRYRFLIQQGGLRILEFWRSVIPPTVDIISSIGDDACSDVLGRRRNELKQRATLLSRSLAALENRPESWRELQFLHISVFPFASCSNCSSTVCMRCGETPYHDGLDCHEHILEKLEHLDPESEAAVNLRWKLENSKSCPNCSVLINREEGCNKVDCLQCGFKFCWMCRRKWSEKCGFYLCQEQKSGSINGQDFAVDQNKSVDEKPELGVPDIVTIQSRLKPNQREQVAL